MDIFRICSLIVIAMCANGSDTHTANFDDYIKVTQLRQNMGLYFDYMNKVKFVADSWNFVIEIDQSNLLQKLQDVYTHGANLSLTAKSFANCSNSNTIQLDVQNHVLDKCQELLEYHRDIENKIKLVSEDAPEQVLSITTASPQFMHNLRKRDAPPKRVRRGLVDIVGKVDKYLFGVMDSDDAQELHNLAKSSNAINEQVKSLTTDLIEMSNVIEQRLSCIEQELKFDSKCDYLEKVYQALRDELDEIEKNYERLSMAVDFAEQNQLNSYVISPEALLEAMQNIESDKLKNLDWPIKLDIKEMYALINGLIVTHTFVTASRTIVFIVEVPLVKNIEFDLFRSITVPMCNKYDSCVLIIPSSKYVGFNDNRFQYVRMDDINSCKPINNRLVCLKSHIVYQTSSANSICDVQIFNAKNMTTNFEQLCDVRVGKFHRETIERISDHNRYMYVLKEDKIVNTQCFNNSQTIHFNGEKLKAGVGIIEGTGAYRCEMSTDQSTLPFQELKSTLTSVLTHTTNSEFQLNAFVADAARIHLNDTMNQFNLDHKTLQQITTRLTDLRARMNNNTVYKGRDITDDEDVLGSWWDSLDFGLWKDLKVIFYILIVIVVCVAAYKVYVTCFASNTTTTKTIIRNNYDREMVYLKPQPVPTSDNRRHSNRYDESKF
ncbi:efp [Leucania separata nucleopolyhedrovirus]|uniref:Efp n=1 Tax=Leucania separata nucleopolyhedrovirus TaxID=1307956 RepID=Q0IKV3_NPVLS|nr:efp [Leucania separata nucleopolyhedrovirus]AAR28930.1 efp [Leucania separata nucleopolyhedrovirus]